MIVKEYFYNVECDCCHKSLGCEMWQVDKSTAEEEAYDNGEFKHLGGKDYCPECWEYGDSVIRTKDGKVWDEDSEEEITETATK